jgi:hypothetical protein
MTARQLSFDVPLHVALAERQSEDTEPYLTGSIKIGGEFHCPVDVNAGERLTVTVADADGTVVAQGEVVATYPRFKEISDRGIVIGTERINVVKAAG